MSRYYILFVLLLLTCGLAAQDVEGSSDHPLVNRFPGATIGFHQVEKFVPYYIAVGPVVSYRKIDDWLEVEGQHTRIYYTIKTGSTFYEVYQNYRNAAQRSDFKMLAEGAHPDRNIAKTVGGGSWMTTAYSRNPFPTNSPIRLLQGSATVGGSGFFAAQLSRPEGDVYLVVGAKQYKADEVVVLVDIIETASLEDGKINLTEDYLSQAIESEGRVVLDGLYFDFDQSTLTAESTPSLETIAAFLKQQSALQFYVVGHTDMTGSLEYNRKLSQERAEAVISSLVEKYGIAKRRLEAHGLGFLAPRANNATEEGRAKNRRVELVLKKE